MIHREGHKGQRVSVGVSQNETFREAARVVERKQHRIKSTFHRSVAAAGRAASILKLLGKYLVSIMKNALLQKVI